ALRKATSLADTAPNGSRTKKIFKGPLLYIILAPIIVLLGWSLLSGSGQREVTTQQGLEMLANGDVTQAQIIDGDQRVNLTLAKADADTGATEVFFYYVAPRGGDIVEAVTAAAPKD